MMDLSKNSKLEPELTMKKIKNGGFQSETTQDNLLSKATATPELGVDELSLILSSYWISKKELLNFRLVNKIWCDAATSTLLQRDECFVTLKMDSNQNEFYFHKQIENQSKLVGQLTDLMSNSHKFPATDFRIKTSITEGAPINYSDYPDLLLFFELHGKKIKTLGPRGWISHKCLMDIFTIYTPNLECLDLSRTTLRIKSQDFPDDDLKRISKALHFKSLHFSNFWKDGYYVSEPDYSVFEDENRNNNANDCKLIHLLLSSVSKISCIENVALDTLGSVLAEEKGQLVRSFTCNVSDSLSNFKSTVMQFAQLNPRLSTVTLDFGINSDDASNIDVPLINAFINSFKDTVQDFDFYFPFIGLESSSLFKIPPMKCLKSISLTFCDECFPEADVNAFDFRRKMFAFEDGILAKDYFPSLRKVSMDAEDADHVQGSMMSFFAFKSESGGLAPVWDHLSTVEVLKISDTAQSVRSIGTVTRNSRREPRPIQVPLFSEMFPNIRILKIRVDQAPTLAADVWWKICPKVEFMEIRDLGKFNTGSDDVDVSDSNVELSLLVDKFFTGFPSELCFKLRTAELPQEILSNPELLQFLRVAPSVCDLRHLRELKLRFLYKLHTEFATQVTGKYAFAKMPNTKFIISYNPPIFVTNKAYARTWTNVSNSSFDSDSSDGTDGSEDVEDNCFANDGNIDDDQNPNVNNFDKKGKNNKDNIDDDDDDDEIQNYEERCFGSLTPYVEIVREVYAPA